MVTGATHEPASPSGVSETRSRATAHPEAGWGGNGVPGDRVEVLAPAKVNLCLEVLGRRVNGYHDIRSLVVPVSLCDRLSLALTDGEIETRVTVYGPGAADDSGLVDSPRNLATRAAGLLRCRVGGSAGVRIDIDKHIPVGGGLGGGSADAAAVLRGLRDLWRLDCSDAFLMEVGAELGCDVPALVHGGAVIVEGMGERVRGVAFGGRPVPAPWVVIVNPGFRVSTADVYARCMPPLTSGAGTVNSMVSALQEGDLAGVAKSLYNGLQGAVFRKYPLIEMVAEGLKRAGSPGVLLCGSGASVLGLAYDEAHAGQVSERVRDLLGFPVWLRGARALPDGVTVAHGPLEARV